jgi:hypothetical protein
MHQQDQIICDRSAVFAKDSFFIEKCPANAEKSKRKD